MSNTNQETKSPSPKQIKRDASEDSTQEQPKTTDTKQTLNPIKVHPTTKLKTQSFPRKIKRDIPEDFAQEPKTPKTKQTVKASSERITKTEKRIIFGNAHYAIAQEVSKKFLTWEREENEITFSYESKEGLRLNPRVEELFEDFKGQYDDREVSTLDITGLSSRARIMLLAKIINYKLSTLPDVIGTIKNYPEWKNLVIDNSEYWEKGVWKVDTPCDITDKYPTTFLIGEYSYELKQGPCWKQRGSGRIFGLRQPNEADKYFQISSYLGDFTIQDLDCFSHNLKKQKKDGTAINLKRGSWPDLETSRFINGFNLLLDFEVARRLVPVDRFPEVPVIYGICDLLDNFSNLDYINTKYFAGLFADQNDRKQYITPLKELLFSPRCSRAQLWKFHDEEEYSGESYEDSLLDENVDLFKIGKDHLKRSNYRDASFAFLSAKKFNKLPPDVDVVIEDLDSLDDEQVVSFSKTLQAYSKLFQ